MIEVIYDSKQKARKDYRDDSAEFVRDGLDYLKEMATFSELRAIARLKANNWKILKGQVYTRQVNKVDGDVYTFRSLPEIAALCHKHQLYPEY
jgi:hypothetical protein